MRVTALSMLIASLLLAACASGPQRALAGTEPASNAPQLSSPRFGPPMAVPQVDSLFVLNDAQQKEFLDFFAQPGNAVLKPNERIYAYLEQRLYGFRYYGATRTAEQALSTGEGNCLTLALLTTALAQLAGVEISYQRIRNEPVYERQGNVVMVADHVRSLLFEPMTEAEVEAGTKKFQTPYIAIDYFPEHHASRGGRVGIQTLKAMFYTNLAGEAMAAGADRHAYWLLQAALAQAPDSAGALNSLAVLYRRTGDDSGAEAIYRHALQRNGDQQHLLSNYRNLLVSQERLTEAADIERRLSQLPIRNPYDLLELGHLAYLQQRPQAAIELFERALKQAPYLHEALWRQAVVHHSLGNTKKAMELLDKAVETAARDADKRLYQAKLQTVSSREQAR